MERLFLRAVGIWVRGYKSARTKVFVHSVDIHEHQQTDAMETIGARFKDFSG